MKPIARVWKFIADNLAAKKRSVLLFVLDSKGSSPGRQGFCMAINEDDAMEGSIGGGIMEHKFVEMARSVLRDRSSLSDEGQIRNQVHSADSKENRSGMICSGEQTLWIYPVKDEDAAEINKIVEGYAQHKGALRLDESGIKFLPSGLIKQKTFSQEEAQWNYTELLDHENQLTIIGGGHCSLALSKLFSSMDFYIRVYDTRANLTTMEKNEWAMEKHTIHTYADLENIVQSGVNHYLVIMSFGYRTDDEALRALKNKTFKYLGILGSRKKIETMMTVYKEEGFNPDFLQQVHAPVGVQIHSQTPEEIAISIAAEIIAIKNKREE